MTFLHNHEKLYYVFLACNMKQTVISDGRRDWLNLNLGL